jgi:hypothetical protein
MTLVWEEDRPCSVITSTKTDLLADGGLSHMTLDEVASTPRTSRELLSELMKLQYVEFASKFDPVNRQAVPPEIGPNEGYNE